MKLNDLLSLTVLLLMARPAVHAAEAPKPLGSVAASATTMDLVTDGAPKAVIVIPANPSGIADWAAKELQYHVKRASKAALEIVREGRQLPEGKGRIYVGPCRRSLEVGLHAAQFPENGYCIRVSGDEMFLLGRDGDCHPPLEDNASMGTLYAVYEWLETRMGVRWLWPGELGTVVPPAGTVSSGPAGERQGSSPFLHTRLRIGAGLGIKEMDLTKEEYDRFIYDTSVWLRRHRFGRALNLNYPHAFDTYWKRFGKEHPDYFALRPDGQRGPVDQRTDLVQMCVSNPGFQNQVVADWLKQRRPDKPWINGCENDSRYGTDPACTCPLCRAWDVKDTEIRNAGFAQPAMGAHSDRYARFWLALQREGRKHDPEATVFGLAYADYDLPPLETALNDHIIVGIVPTASFPLSQRGRADFRKLWSGWARTGARLFLRPNYFLEGYCLPFIFAKDFADQFHFAAQHNMIATDFDSLTSMWGVQGPNLYMLGRINQRPDMSADAIMAEYYSGFGPASDAVRQYFEHWEQVTRRKDDNYPRVGGWNTLGWTGDDIYTLETIAQAGRLLDAARTAAASDPEALRRVEFLGKGLAHTKLVIETMRAHRAWKAGPSKPLRDAFTARLRALDDYRRTIKNDYVVDLAFLSKVEVWSSWRVAKPVQK